MPAKLDMSIAESMFQETFGREVRPTERYDLRTAQYSTLILASAEDFAELWARNVAEQVVITEENWDEFALVGCLDGAP